MPFRPTAPHRRNIKGVIYPLTAAVARTFGIRHDGAYPIGAFYTINIDTGIWAPAGGIWYLPTHPSHIEERSVPEEDIDIFVSGITRGTSVVLRSGRVVLWEPIPAEEASQLPAIRPHFQ